MEILFITLPFFFLLHVLWLKRNEFKFPTLMLERGGTSQVELVVKNPPANAEDAGDAGSIPVLGRRRAEQPTPVFLPAEPHEQRSLAVYRVAQSRTQLK